MNIQRKYSLPNCTLLLEGLSDATRAAHLQELRPELSILVNAECYISGYKKPISGGREFFESLVRAVSAYAQEFLSNIPNPQARDSESELVQLQKVSRDRHRLVVHSENASQETGANSHGQPTTEIDLNTVQLFDLVEAIDQFFADSQTLPELSLKVQPVARRYGNFNQALVKQAVPAGIGVTSLAAAAVAFSIIPVPEIRPPQQNNTQPTSSTTSRSNALASPGVTPTPAPNEPVAASPTFTPTPTSTTASESTPASLAASVNPTTPTPTPTPTAPEATAPTPIPNPTAVKDLEALLNTVPEITDASVLRALQRQVYNQINPEWANRSALTQDSVFRVGVAGDGSLVGYKAVNKASNDAVANTPLPKLLYNPANSRGPITNEPIAQFKVVFTNRGILEISPWRGYTKTPEVIGSKITDANTIGVLNQKLTNTIRQGWRNTASFPKDLKYRVALNKDGAIADYEPLNQVAFDYFRQTPLPKMFQQDVYGSNTGAPNSKEPLAHFQVVFKPDGNIEVTPWKGYGQ
ncbi:MULTISPECIES: DUF4335 domain-containing protein [Nostocales]|uniref:DUF4335 domain-containing protein n=3 Tax=Nostocales TaxID=1161 RepID=A0A0C1N961_9CYAN|nr:DUF4335 domain-containing protein [Tolypothrix bouteillei]KAF3887232.1 DUF4335 domain-containing protein [Tolypothrix bouteillei VB521301]